MVAVLLAAVLGAFHVAVPAAANLFGAGTGGVADNGGGLNPIRIRVPAGAHYLVITQADGRVSCCGGTPSNGAGGGASYATNIRGSGGISAVLAPVNMFLAGVFTGAGTAPPPAAVIRMPLPPLGTPALRQIFYAGRGRRIAIPAGATALYFGFADSNGPHRPPGAYADNVGLLDVRGEFRSR